MLVLAFGLAFTPVLYGEDFIGGGDDGGSGLDGIGGGTTGDGSTGAGSTGGGTTGDGTTGDGTTGDGTTGDGTTGDGTTGDGTTGDGITDDGTTGDGITDDGTTGDGITDDGTTGDGTTGDGTTGDGTTGDGTTGDGCIGDESTGEDAGGDCTGGLDPEQEEDLTEQGNVPFLMTFNPAIGGLGAFLPPLNNEPNLEYEDYLDDLAEKYSEWYNSKGELSLPAGTFEDFIEQLDSDPVLAQKYADFLAMIAKNGMTIELPGYLEGELIDDPSLICFYWFYHFGNYSFRDYVDFALEQGEFLGGFALFAMASSVGPPTYCKNGVHESGQCVEEHGPPTKCENGVHESGQCVEKYGPPTYCGEDGDYRSNHDGSADDKCRPKLGCVDPNFELVGNLCTNINDDSITAPVACKIGDNYMPYFPNGPCDDELDPPTCEYGTNISGTCVEVLGLPKCEKGEDKSGQCVTVLGPATCPPGSQPDGTGGCDDGIVGGGPGIVGGDTGNGGDGNFGDGNNPVGNDNGEIYDEVFLAAIDAVIKKLQEGTANAAKQDVEKGKQDALIGAAQMSAIEGFGWFADELSNKPISAVIPLVKAGKIALEGGSFDQILKPLGDWSYETGVIMLIGLLVGAGIGIVVTGGIVATPAIAASAVAGTSAVALAKIGLDLLLALSSSF